MSQETPQKTQLVPFGKQGVQLSTLEDAFRFAVAVSKSGFAPKGVDTPEAILIAVQFGAELGLTPMSSLQSLAIINGRPAIYGDAALALVRASGELEHYQQSTSGEGENAVATVRVKRKGESEIVSTFSVADAKKAQLWGKQGPWSQYPGRMLMWRARGFALRDAFSDVLRGLRTSEEAEDMPEIKNVTPVPRAKAPKEALPSPDATLTTNDSGNLASETSNASNPIGEPTLEQKLQAVLDVDKITNAELLEALTFFEVKVPKDFKGPESMKDKTIEQTIEGFPVLRDHIMARREKGNQAP